MEDKKHPQGRNVVEELMACKKLGGTQKNNLTLIFLGGADFLLDSNLLFGWNVGIMEKTLDV